MFGGVGMGASIAALERTCKRPVIWATAQYLSFARPPSVVDLDVRAPVHGRNISQARVISHVGDKEVLTVNAALGAREGEVSHQWAKAPAVPPPEDCEETARWNSDHEGLHSHIEVRVASGRHLRQDHADGPSADGRLMLWIRPRGDHAIDSTMLAIMADHVPSGISHALGRQAGGNSLDNTIRMVEIVPTDWVLCDVRIDAAYGGVIHGAMKLYARDGRLMATASQSMLLRVWDGESA